MPLFTFVYIYVLFDSIQTTEKIVVEMERSVRFFYASLLRQCTAMTEGLVDSEGIYNRSI